MWIKICANTNLEDALEAVRLGADAVGFVFAPSRRQVTAAAVREMVAELPAEVEKVGVFAALGAAEIARAAQEAGLDTIQLHGGWDAALTDELARLVPAMQLIQTAHWDVGEARAEGRVRAALARMPDNARVLVDARVGHASGGTGQSFDWAAARAVFDAAGARKMILAGGLRPDNVGQAVRTLRPWGLDVASGVEREPGRKDGDRLRQFMENARNA